MATDNIINVPVRCYATLIPEQPVEFREGSIAVLDLKNAEQIGTTKTTGTSN